jgi:putative aldouronate transport system permease protein
VYRRGLLEANYSFATAVGLFNSALNFMFLWFANWLSRRVNEYSLW